MFFDIWKCIYSESLVNTLYIEIKHKCKKKIPLDKINIKKNVHFFISRAPTNLGCTFNLQFLYKLKHKIYISKRVCGIFHFRFRLIFIKVLFLFNKKHIIFVFKAAICKSRNGELGNGMGKWWECRESRWECRESGWGCGKWGWEC